MNRFQRIVTATVGAAVLAAPAAARSPPSRRRSCHHPQGDGSSAQADRWGYLQVTLTVRKTTTTVGTKKKVTRKIIRISIPQYPNHTDRRSTSTRPRCPI